MSQSCANMIPEEQESSTNFIQNVSYNFFDIAHAAGKFARNPHSTTALEYFFEKLKALEKEWYEFGVKFEQLQRQNENLLHECERERNKSKVYQKRLKFVKDNQENFDRLREVYSSMRILEDRDVAERECQTDVLQDVVPVQRASLDVAKETLNRIKEMVEAREERHEDSNRTIEGLRADISKLEKQNSRMMQMLTWKYVQERTATDDEPVNIHKEYLAPRPLDQMRNSSAFNSKRLEPAINLTPTQDVDDTKFGGNKSDEDPEAMKYAIKYAQMSASLTKAAPSYNDRSAHLTREASDEIVPLRPKYSKYTNSTVSSMSSRRKKVRHQAKGDAQEVEVLKKIRSEIEKRQMSIREKIDKFNQTVPD